MCRRKLQKRVSLSVGAPLGNLGRGGGPFTGNFERKLKEGSGNGASVSAGALLGKPGRGAPLLWIREESSGDRHLSPRGPR
jgi:hypothetical protein